MWSGDETTEHQGHAAQKSEPISSASVACVLYEGQVMHFMQLPCYSVLSHNSRITITADHGAAVKMLRSKLEEYAHKVESLRKEFREV